MAIKILGYRMSSIPQFLPILVIGLATVTHHISVAEIPTTPVCGSAVIKDPRDASSCAEPSCSGHNPGDYIPNPMNCYQYHVCLANCYPSDVVFQCPEGELFDADAGKCMTEFETSICNVCSVTCEYSCPLQGDGIIADKHNCSKFFLCGLSETPISIECPTEEPFFDGIGCQKDIARCCDPCLVYCEEAFTQIPDPANCNNFYFCMLDSYYPGPEDIHHCPEGEVFDASASHCLENGICEIQCTGLRQQKV